MAGFRNFVLHKHAFAVPRMMLLLLNYIVTVFSRTYIYNTISYTSIVFVTGALTWWAPTAVEHAWAMRNHKQDATKEAKAK